MDDASRHAAVVRGAELLRAGRLVAFPTETVYGLGANALDDAAVQRIFEVKGRPAVNPLIVHVSSVTAARELALDWPAAADAIARAFWPGPLTIVVRKRATIPDVVTAGGNSVGLRVPAHPFALALLTRAAVPVAAPSANRSTQVSPTTAQHVVRGLGDRVDLIIDGGPTSVGIESTVVDVTAGVPRILRPGMIAKDAIARVAGAAESVASSEDTPAPRSPGMLGKHYSPQARVFLVAASQLASASARHRAAGRMGVMAFAPAEGDVVHVMPRDPDGYARALYATLHAMDDAGCDVVLIELPPPRPEWAAIQNRLERAAR